MSVCLPCCQSQEWHLLYICFSSILLTAQTYRIQLWMVPSPLQPSMDNYAVFLMLFSIEPVLLAGRVKPSFWDEKTWPVALSTTFQLNNVFSWTVSYMGNWDHRFALSTTRRTESAWMEMFPAFWGTSLREAKCFIQWMVILMHPLTCEPLPVPLGDGTKQGHLWFEWPRIWLITCIRCLPSLPNFNFGNLGIFPDDFLNRGHLTARPGPRPFS